MAMLHFLYNCLSGNTSQKKMFFKIHVLYIDEGRSVYGWTDEEAEQHRQLIVDTCGRYGFNFTVVGIESVYDVDRDTLNE